MERRNEMIMRYVILVQALLAVLPCRADYPLAGADEQTLSRSQYFSWINNTNEGSTEEQTLVNLAFFRWLHDEYGMKLDIYAWDAGNLDGARNEYGTMASARFREHYPHGWKVIADAAAEFGCRLGLWGGPDGFGDTPQEAAARRELMAGLCRDYHLALFKFDRVCGDLREGKQDEFVRMMEECRSYSPELILLNHRLSLGRGLPLATTSLWEGLETYIDVHLANSMTAPHHRAQALSRSLPPGLTRLTEDHGVCLSSCLDAWEDDLVLQAFNRSLILAPEIYGNPWLLRDDEFPRLARLFNLYRRNRELLVAGMVLPKASYGPNAVSRGDARTRFVTLRNLTWMPVTYQVRLNNEIGLAATGEVAVRRLHPHERVIGSFARDSVLPVEVEPFRVCLLEISTQPINDLGIEGCDAEMIREVPGKPVILKLLGLPGTSPTVMLHTGTSSFSAATLDGRPLPGFARGQPVQIEFPGNRLTQPWHRKLAELQPCAVPADAEALYEATCFAADNDALEVRSLRRSGSSAIPAVQKARTAFFQQPLFRSRCCWSRLLFDGDETTAFAIAADPYRSRGETGGTDDLLRIDLAAPVKLDRLEISLARGSTGGRAESSPDLRTWTPAETVITAEKVVIRFPAERPVRYVRLARGSLVPTEVNGFHGGQPLDREHWRASNLFADYPAVAATRAWSATVTITEAAPGSYLCIALAGEHGNEGAWVAARLNGQLLGCPDRSPSFRSNTFESPVARRDRNHTWYLPVTAQMIGQPLEIVTLTLAGGKNDYQPSIWITTQSPLVGREIVLQ
jgi:hypothetical protein